MQQLEHLGHTFGDHPQHFAVVYVSNNKLPPLEEPRALNFNSLT